MIDSWIVFQCAGINTHPFSAIKISVHTTTSHKRPPGERLKFPISGFLMVLLSQPSKVRTINPWFDCSSFQRPSYFSMSVSATAPKPVGNEPVWNPALSRSSSIPASWCYSLAITCRLLSIYNSVCSQSPWIGWYSCSEFTQAKASGCHGGTFNHWITGACEAHGALCTPGREFT